MFFTIVIGLHHVLQMQNYLLFCVTVVLESMFSVSVSVPNGPQVHAKGGHCDVHYTNWMQAISVLRLINFFSTFILNVIRVLIMFNS